VGARYARAIALYRTAALGSALLTIDGCCRSYPNDPYFHELRGQMLFENGRAGESLASYRRAVQLLPAVGIVKIDFARPLLETNKPRTIASGTQPRTRRSRVGQLRPVALMAGLFQAEQRHDLAGARRDGDHRGTRRGAPMPPPPSALQRARRLAARPGLKAYISSRPRRYFPEIHHALLLILCGGLLIAGAIWARADLPATARRSRR
jgi:hypothetical protein